MDSVYIADLKLFISEALEHIDEIENSIIALEKTRDDEEHINNIFRHVHTIKGDSGYLHLKGIGKLNHSFETLLNTLKDGKREIDDNTINLFYKFIDFSKQAFRKFTEYCKLDSLNEDFIEEKLESNEQLIKLIEEIKRSNESLTFKKERKVSEKEIKTNEIELIYQNQRESPTLDFIKVKSKKIDKLMELVGELSILQSIISEKSIKNIQISSDLGKEIKNLKKISEGIQKNVMETRLTPLADTFNRIKRVLRDLVKKYDKKVEFQVSGEETEIDKTIIQELPTILGHLIRNSIDHGIENENERKKSGKSASGAIKIEAYHERNYIIIEVSDNGRGLSIKKLKELAITKKLIDNDNGYSDREILNLIFLPGFSLSEEITDVSGRGVGLDVVKKTIEKFNGRVTVESEEKNGTTFRLEFPESTAIVDNIIVTVGDNKYLIPAALVTEIVHPEESAITRVVGKGEILNFRDSTVELIRLDEILGLVQNNFKTADGFVVIIESHNTKKGLVVEKVLDKQQIVMKSVQNRLIDSEIISGFTILGDGNVSVILNVNEILEG